jgi:hypothetical protein
VTTFRANVYQNEYLSKGGTEVNAIVTIEASGSTGAPVATSAAEIVMVDVSGSMSNPPTKIRSARRATEAAIDCIRDGVHFGIVAGSHEATELYPGAGELAVASDATRAAAKRAAANLEPGGGTAIGTWLRLTANLFRGHPDAICHAILLTDGLNEHETPKDLTNALQACEGVFVCDCRGAGADWSVDELRSVSSALLGTVGIIREPEEMTADFASIMRSAMAKAVDDVALRVWTPQGASVRFVQQVSPTIEDLTTRRVEVNERAGDYPTPAWGDEARDYHLCIDVPAREVDEEMLAGRVSLVVGGEALSEAKVLAIWTDDNRPFTKQVPVLDHYTTELRKSNLIEDGKRALDEDDIETATERFAAALVIAQATDDTEKVDMIETLVDVDPTTGKVTMKADIDPLDVMEIDIGSRKTQRVRE